MYRINSLQSRFFEKIHKLSMQLIGPHPAQSNPQSQPLCVLVDVVACPNLHPIVGYISV